MIKISYTSIIVFVWVLIVLNVLSGRIDKLNHRIETVEKYLMEKGLEAQK